ncbi:hypothetical protein EI94DRAFT_1705014 [Lactarius quietus]|nr:hypothetical protein EI94DRAFT_1705014 [Lactarius quietus]
MRQLQLMRRHRFIVLIVLAALGSLGTALSPHWHDMRTKHSWRAVPHEWVWIWSTSHQGAPHPDTLNLVNAWLDYNGIPSSSVSLTHGSNSLKLTRVPLSQANELLGASYQIYKHVTTNETIVRTSGYALPVALHELVKTVVPTTSFDFPRTQWQKFRNGFDGADVWPDDVVSGQPVTEPSIREVVDVTTPSFLTWVYSTWVYSTVATSKSRLGIVGYLSQFPNLQDLRLFMRKYRSEGADATFDVVPVNGGRFEANFDLQRAQGIAYPIRHVFYSTGRGELGEDDWYLSFLENVIEHPNIPQTISLSLFAQLSTRGVSVLQGSGDDGVGPGACRDSSGNVHFTPLFPSTSIAVIARVNYRYRESSSDGPSAIRPPIIVTIKQLEAGNCALGLFSTRVTPCASRVSTRHIRETCRNWRKATPTFDSGGSLPTQMRMCFALVSTGLSQLR